MSFEWATRFFRSFRKQPRKPMGEILYMRFSEEQWCPCCEELNTLMVGPSGGLSTNISCGACGALYNYTPLLSRLELLQVPSVVLPDGTDAYKFPQEARVKWVMTALEDR